MLCKLLCYMSTNKNKIIGKNIIGVTKITLTFNQLYRYMFKQHFSKRTNNVNTINDFPLTISLNVNCKRAHTCNVVLEINFSGNK